MSINIFNIIAGPATGNSLIPARDPSAITGSAWVQANMNLGGATREANILKEFMAGNVPDFLRKFAPVIVTDGTNTITYIVTPDLLCLGSDADYVRMPMNPLTAQKIADKYDCTMPTRKMANDIWKQSTNKITPKPWGPPYNSDMEKTHRIGTHNTTINNQLKNLGMDPFVLTDGHKKDVVLTNKLAPNNPNKKVAIYGWIQSNGQPIQGLNPSSHSDTYQDYSHGIRLIANDVIVNGNAMRIQDVFSDSKLCGLLSDEGVLKFQRY